MSRLTLYGRDGCHLCDDARAVLQGIGEPFDEVDIESDDDLFKRYLEKIPVLHLDGSPIYCFFIDEPDLRSRLGRVGRA